MPDPLYDEAGEAHCPKCGKRLQRDRALDARVCYDCGVVYD